MASLSGWLIPTNVISQGSYIWVRFTSDNDINWNQYRGFRALPSAVRAIILNTEDTEVLTSPNYPGPYENNIGTIWYVRAPAGYRVLLRFSNFSTEETYDTVTVRDGRTSNYSRSTRRASLLGQYIPENIMSAGSHMWIQFTSNSMYGDTGFRALLHAVIPVIILQTNETQNLTSPNFPSWYDNNIDVVWHLRAPSGYRITVHFSEFYTESDRDLVYLYDGKTSEFQSSSLRGNLSGSYVPRNITTVGAYLWIRFISDNWNDNYYTGFKAMLMTVETTVIMLDTIETENISSPNFPVYYDNNLDIALQVIAPAGYRVHVHFRHFETKENSDFVYIYEGWTSDFSRSTLRASLPGWSIPENITSIGSYLWIRFASNEGTRFRGFQNRDIVRVYEGWTSNYSRSMQKASLSGGSLPSDIVSRGSYLWVHFTSDNCANNIDFDDESNYNARAT
eukprot:XP_011676898.1 PREDICTED: cubilin-like [Strongylocentrotus purpuratus]